MQVEKVRLEAVRNASAAQREVHDRIWWSAICSSWAAVNQVYRDCGRCNEIFRWEGRGSAVITGLQVSIALRASSIAGQKAGVTMVLFMSKRDAVDRTIGLPRSGKDEIFTCFFLFNILVFGSLNPPFSSLHLLLA
ncbi:hypothetical protein L6452_21438 [Arctium lappa]|uniref:Uncharacterized protein n=1 Tax=Arctium lappa TaxID=4217 RepID=A0ACB9AYN9_ARCLA|nr:hypothetical protein L6452_21438 [Arctium lappa]